MVIEFVFDADRSVAGDVVAAESFAEDKVAERHATGSAERALPAPGSWPTDNGDSVADPYSSAVHSTRLLGFLPQGALGRRQQGHRGPGGQRNTR